MVYDEVTLYNLALNAIGARSNVETTQERSREAEVCRLWYPVVRDQIFAAAHWPSAQGFKRLALLNERDFDEDWVSTNASPGFAFAYSTPDDMLRPRHLTSFARFTLTTYPGNLLAINTNVDEAILSYTRRQEVISLWDAELQMAVVYGLASNICMPLSGKPARAKLMLQQANDLIQAARAGSANIDTNALETLPDWILARGYGTPSSTERYLYPHGGTLTLAGENVG